MKTISIFTKRAVAVAAAFVSVTCAASAAEEIIPQIQLDNVPLADAIGNLARQSEFNYILDPRVPGSPFGPGRVAPKPSVTARWTNVTAQTALSALLKEHKLTMVTNPATTVIRIAPVDAGVKPVPASRVGTNTAKIIPVVVLDFVSVTEALTKLVNAAGLKVSFDPKVSAPSFDGQGTVSLSWKEITIRQALAALLDNYGLIMSEDSGTSTARIMFDPKADVGK